MRLLVDEDLSPRLTSTAHQAGYDATCIRDRGRLSSSDAAVAALAFAEDRVLVTNNILDFRELGAVQGIHPGLIHLPLGSVERLQSWLAMLLPTFRRIPRRNPAAKPSS